MHFLENIADKILNFLHTKDSFLYYQIKPYQYNEYTISQNLWFLHNFAWVDEEIDFVVVHEKSSLKFIVKLPKSLAKYFENTFYANFSDSELVKIENKKTIKLINSQNKKYLKFSFDNEWDFKSMQDFQEKEYLDPFKDVLSIFENMPGDVSFVLWYKVKSNNDSIFSDILNFFKKLFHIKVEENKKDLKVTIYFSNNISEKHLKNITEKNIKNVFKKYLKNWKITISSSERFYNQNFDQFVNFFHILHKDYFIKNFEYLSYKKLSAPLNLPTKENTENLTLLWETDYKNYDLKFGIKEEDKLRHCYIIWKTWMWKSTLISNMLRDDLRQNKWVCVVDPHWDLVDTILEYVPSWRINDVILFDVSDFEYPIGFNILQYKNDEEKNIIVSGIVSTFKKLYDNSWGPRLEYILRNSLLAVIEYPNATLLHLTRMLTDKNFLKEVLEYVKDPLVLKFFNDEFLKRADNFRNEAVSPIVNKVGQFLSSPIVRNIFWQTNTKLDIRKIMDEWKILLVNLSKWKIWEDNATMIGSFLVTKFQIDAMARADMAFNDRKAFYLYIDEFQNFATDSFESILSEARKYKLSLIMANQYITQIPDNIKSAIFGNVWTIVSFGIWVEDSELISKQFKEIITSKDLLSLPKFKAYIKLMIDGVVSDPFSMKTFPLPEKENWPEIKEKIKKQTQQAYAMKKDIIEQKIRIWAENKFTLTDKALQKVSKTWWVKSIDELKEWVYYDGIIKLKYNFWVFIALDGGEVEWLLHKKKMKVPEWLTWKQMYNIWDKVKVQLDKIKEKDGEKAVEFKQ